MGGTWRVLVVLVGLALFGVAAAQGTGAVGPQRFEVPIYFFWGDGCPHCATQKVFLGKLVEDHPYVVVYDFEVYYVPRTARCSRPWRRPSGARYRAYR